MTLALSASLLLALSRPGATAPAAKDCKVLDGVGCYYVPAAVRGKSEPVLLVYLRGDTPGYPSGMVPKANRVTEAREAFRSGDSSEDDRFRYGLGATADEAGIAVLVAGSNNVVVTPAAIEKIENDEKIVFGRLIVASHSGSNSPKPGHDIPALAAALSRLAPSRQVERVVMLDNFFSVAAVDAVKSVPCNGFYTQDSIDQYKKFYPEHIAAYKKNGCVLEPVNDGLGVSPHNEAVDACLKFYIKGASCALKSTGRS